MCRLRAHALPNLSGQTIEHPTTIYSLRVFIKVQNDKETKKSRTAIVRMKKIDSQFSQLGRKHLRNSASKIIMAKVTARIQIHCQ